MVIRGLKSPLVPFLKNGNVQLSRGCVYGKNCTNGEMNEMKDLCFEYENVSWLLLDWLLLVRPKTLILNFRVNWSKNVLGYNLIRYCYNISIN